MIWAYEEFKDLPKRTTPDKVLHNKVFVLPKIQNIMDINVGLLQWFL